MGKKGEKREITNVAAVAIAAALEPIFDASIALVDAGVGVHYGQSGRRRRTRSNWVGHGGR